MIVVLNIYVKLGIVEIIYCVSFFYVMIFFKVLGWYFRKQWLNYRGDNWGWTLVFEVVDIGV